MTPDFDFEHVLDVIRNPSASIKARESYVQSFKYFALSYITALQGSIEHLSESDPIRQQLQAALDEVSTSLLDR